MYDHIMNENIKLIEEKLYSMDGIFFIENEISLLFNAIRKTHHINEASTELKKLENIQFVLAKAIFKNQLKVSPFLRDFVSDFDRIDDDDMKKHIYVKIKSS